MKLPDNGQLSEVGAGRVTAELSPASAARARTSRIPAAVRWYRPDLLYEVCIRTLDGRFFFDPAANPEVAEAFHGMVAQAQSRTGVSVYAYFAMSNHYHGLYSAPSAAAMADFLSHLHAALARWANRAWDRNGRVFAATAHVVPVIPDEVSVGERLTYIMGQALKAGVATGLESWPGASTNAALLGGEPVRGVRFDRRRQTLDKRLMRGAGPDEDYRHAVEVDLSVVPCWRDLDDAAIRARYQAAGARAVELWGPKPPFVQPADDPGDSAAATEPAPAVTASPQSRPAPRTKRGRRLVVHAPSAAARAAYIRDYAELCAAWAEAREQLRAETERALAGKPARAVLFPMGTFPGWVRAGGGAAEILAAAA